MNSVNLSQDDKYNLGQTNIAEIEKILGVLGWFFFCLKNKYINLPLYGRGAGNEIKDLDSYTSNLRFRT